MFAFLVIKNFSRGFLGNSSPPPKPPPSRGGIQGDNEYSPLLVGGVRGGWTVTVLVILFETV